MATQVHILTVNVPQGYTNNMSLSVIHINYTSVVISASITANRIFAAKIYV